MRIDVLPDGLGCRKVWENEYDIMSATPKLSLPTGLIYVYDRAFKGRDYRDNVWALSALDFRTGQPVFQIPVGRGFDYLNAWGPITILGDRALYVALLGGFVRIQDSDTPTVKR